MSQPTNAGSILFNTTGYSITGNTLTLSGGGTAAGEITLAPGVGAATITSALAGSNGLTFNGDGNGTLTLNGIVANTWTGTTRINGGQITLLSTTAAGAAALTLGDVTSGLTYGGTAIVRYDNGPATANKVWNQGALSFSGGDGTLTNIRTAAFNEQIVFSSQAPRAEGATGSFVINVNGTTVNGSTIATTIGGQANGAMGAGEFFSVNSNGAFAYAVYDTSLALNSVRAVNYATDTSFANTQGAGAAGITVTGPTRYEQITGTVSGQGTAQVATLNINGTSNFTLNAGATFTTQGLLKTGNGTSVIAALGGGTAGITSGGGELILRSDVAADIITLDTTITGATGALTKSGLGTLTLAPNTYTTTGLLVGNPAVTVPNGTFLSVGQTVSGLGIPAGTTISSIAGNVVTLSAAPTITAASAVLQYGASNAYTGTTYVNAGTLTAQGIGALGASTAIHLSGGTTLGSGVSSATTLNLLADGDGLSTLQDLPFGQNVTVVGSDTINVGRLSASTNILNKTVLLGNLSMGEDVLTVTPSNGYGVRFTGATTLTGATGASYISVGTATASNVVQGLTLSGVVSSTNAVNLVKQGLGTLVLGNNSNTFGGTGALIDIQGGILAAGSDAALGNGANTVVLDTNSGTQGFRATGTFNTARTFVLNNLSSAIEVTTGNTFGITTPFLLTAINDGLTKNDAGVLTLSASNPTWTGSIVVNQGAIRVSGPSPSILGSGAISFTIGTVDAIDTNHAIQLIGGATVTNTLTINTRLLSLSTGVNGAGALESISGSNTWTGNIILATGGASIGVDAGTLTLTNSANISGAFNVSLAAGTPGAVGNMNAPLQTGAGTLTKFGPGTWNLNGGSQATGNIAVNGGVLALATQNGTLPAASTSTITAQQGGTFVVDDSTHVPGRLGGGNRALTLNGGGFTLLGNSDAGLATTETIGTGTLTLGSGGSTITLDLNGNTGGGVQFNFGTLSAVAAGETALIRGQNLGGAVGTGSTNLIATNANLVGANNGAQALQIRPDIIGDTSPTGLGTGFVTFVPGTGFRLLDPADGNALDPGAQFRHFQFGLRFHPTNFRGHFLRQLDAENGRRFFHHGQCVHRGRCCSRGWFTLARYDVREHHLRRR